MEKKKNRRLILIAAILVNLSLGAGYAWSVFQQALLLENTSWLVGQTSLAFSISFAMVPIGMIIFGPIIDKEGPKKIVLISGILFGMGLFLTGFAKSIPMLYISYGLILGFGIGAGYGAATATTVKWFPDKKGLAGGLTAAGFGSGAIILAPIAKNMIAARGVYTTFKIFGIILLLVIVAASFFMAKPPASSSSANSSILTEKDKTYKEMLKDIDFWILWLVYTFGATGGMMIIGHAAGITTDYSLGDGALIVMAVSLSNTLGRIFWGAVSDKLGSYKTVILMFIASALGLLLLILNKGLGIWAGILGMILIALSFGGFLGSFPGITVENWGVKNSGSNYGWMFTAYGVAAIVGPSLAASIKEANNNDYSIAFLIAAAMSILGGLLTFYFMKKSKK